MPQSPCFGGIRQTVSRLSALAAIGLLSVALTAQESPSPQDTLNEPLLPPVREAPQPRDVRAIDLAPEASAPAGDPLDGEVRERLLKLRHGPFLRGASVKVDGHWEFKQSDRWIALADGVVESTRLEHRVIRELRERESALGRDAGPEERAQLAEWAFSEGLYREGMAHLDRILERWPDNAEALLLLGDPALPFALPPGTGDAGADVAELAVYGGRAPRTVQELVVRSMGTMDDELVRAELTRRLRSPKSSERCFAALGLRRLYPEGVALQELLRRSVLDPFEDVRHSAALALRDTGLEGLTLPLVRGLESSSSVIRTHSARSLGVMGFSASVEPLATRLVTLRTAAGGDGWRAPASNIFVGRQISFVQDFDTEIATNAAIAKPVIGVIQEGATLDVRVHGMSGGTGGSGGLSYSHNTETKAIRRALASITGEELRDTNTAWRDWWEASGRDWLSKHHPRPGQTAPPAADR